MAKKKTLTNQSRAFIWGGVAILCYLTPIIISCIIFRDRLFKSGAKQLTLFSLIAIIVAVIYAKNIIKKLCDFLTIGLFGAILFLVLSVGIKALAEDIHIISLSAIIGALISWLPTQIMNVYHKHSRTENGDVDTDKPLTVKECVKKLFVFYIFVDKDE